MIAIEMGFPAGRYHSTPWDRQVNEGVVEWPPAPWRLLRALIATWRLKCSAVPQEQIEELLVSLFPPPVFYLPPATPSHTRHFMPAASDRKTKIFDAFLRISKNERLWVIWPDVQMEERSTALLDRLVRNLTYFGRAESWVAARIADHVTVEPNTAPLAETSNGSNGVAVDTLVPLPPDLFQSWRSEKHSELLDRRLIEKQRKAMSKGKEPEKEKLTKTDRAAIEQRLPTTWLEALQLDTETLRKDGWTIPPGSRWVQYLQAENAFDPRRVRTVRGVSLRPETDRQKPTVTRFAVASRVRPRLTDALWLGESIRQVLMGCSKQANPDGQAGLVFSGKQPNGEFREDAHQHAHIMSEATADNRLVNFVTIFASEGFSTHDEDALRRLSTSRIRWLGGQTLHLVLLGIGQPKDFGGDDERAGRTRILSTSQVWRSRTPFVPPQHLKLKAKEKRDPALHFSALRRELIRIVKLELSRRPQFARVADDVEIEPLLGRDCTGTVIGGKFTHWTKFRRIRRTGTGVQAGAFGYGFELRFPEPVPGPIALGFGCHFGLGLFEATQ